MSLIWCWTSNPTLKNVVLGMCKFDCPSKSPEKVKKRFKKVRKKFEKSSKKVQRKFEKSFEKSSKIFRKIFLKRSKKSSKIVIGLAIFWARFGQVDFSYFGQKYDQVLPVNLP